MDDNKGIDLITFKLKGQTPIDYSEYVISLYDTHKRLKSNNEVRYLRPMLVKVLSVYVLYGINPESKKAALECIGIKNESRINMLNKELRDLGYIEKHYNTNHMTDYLCSDLENISKYLKSIFFDGAKEKMKENGIDTTNINFKFELTIP